MPVGCPGCLHSPKLFLLPHDAPHPWCPLWWRSPSRLAIILDTVFQGRKQKQWRAVAGGQRSAGGQGGPAVLTCTTWTLELDAVTVVSRLSCRGLNTGRMTAWLCPVRAVPCFKAQGEGGRVLWEYGKKAHLGGVPAR